MIRNVKTLCGVALLMGALSSVHAQGNGVPVNGFPNADERFVLVLTNRSRADPQADLKDCPNCGERACYQPTTPVTWSYELNRAARFHSSNMRFLGFSHASNCELVPDLAQKYAPDGTCQGDAACACVGGTATGSTAWSTRVSLFGANPTGENIAYGFQSARSVFYAWVWEPDSSTECGFRLTNGHRKNILESGPSLGVGEDQLRWTQDFGYSAVPMGKIVAGANEGSDFYANWYDAQGGGPKSARVNVDGACTPLTLERGTATNGTWRGTVAGSGCRRYAFEFEDSTGAVQVLPEFGAYQDGCPMDYDAAPFARCGAPPIVDAGSVAGVGDAGAPPGATEPPADAGASAHLASSDADAGALAAHSDGYPTVEGTLGCSASLGRSSASLGAALILVVALSRRRQTAS